MKTIVFGKQFFVVLPTENLLVPKVTKGQSVLCE